MGNIAITGGGSGLGKALAHRYAKEGHTIHLLGRDEEKLLITQTEIRQNGFQAEVLACDISEATSIDIAVDQFESLDLLINNAGIGIFGPLPDYTIEDIDQVIDINLKGTILMTKYFLPLIEKAEGRIINVISTAGLRGKVNESLYCASKYGIRGFTESLQKEYENQSVSVTAAYMGGMDTPFWEESDHVEDPGKLKGPEEVADLIFLNDDGRPAIYIDK